MIQKELFFVAGTEKSGTTWVQKLLDAHPEVACRGEGHLVTRLLPELNAALERYNGFVGGLNRKVFSEIEAFPLFDEPRRDSLFRYAASLLLNSYGDVEGVRVVGEKTPGYVRDLERLETHFPQAKLIFVVRDPRDVAVSGWYHLQRQYGEAGREPFDHYAMRIAQVWSNDARRIVDYCRDHPERGVELRYEELKSAPKPPLARVFGFLGVADDESLIEGCIEAADFRRLSGGRKPGEGSASSHFRKGVVGEWLDFFSPQLAERFDEVAGSALRELGYTPSVEALAGRAPRPVASSPVAAQEDAGAAPEGWRELGMSHHARKSWGEAAEAYRYFLREHPDDAGVWCWLGMVEREQGRFDEALDAFRRSLAIAPDDLPTRHMVVTSLFDAGREEEAIAEGQRILEMKDAAVRQGRVEGTEIDESGGAFDPSKPHQNIIAFSLWGSDPVYTRGAVENLRLARNVYYGWTCRYYCAPDVPQEVLETLRGGGAQVVVVEAPELQPLRALWRFFVADDPGVKWFMCRDADSRLNCREALAVDEWLRSGEPFHVMRDHPYHMELMLAGMWGGRAGALPNLQKRVLADDRYVRSRWGDQAFLAEVVWPMIRQRVVVHDALYRMPKGRTRDFPCGYELPGGIHVGGAVKAP